MIKEDYVSYEVAKLLKEKGFNEPVTELNRLLCKEGEKPVLRITHQKAMKWLREVHGLSVETFSIKGTSNVCPVFWKGNVVKLLTQDRVFNGELVGSYEEAIEAALKYCLENLI